MHDNTTGSASLLISALAIALVMASPVVAQISGSGSAQGIVSDPSGAVVPGATVVATNVATGVKTTRETTEAGFYVLAPLPAGEYTVRVSASGFETQVQEHMIVDALSVVGFNVTLKIGATTEQVVVTVTPATINTVDASMNYTIRYNEYEALPMGLGGNLGRDAFRFTTLLPGVTSAVTAFSGGQLMNLPGWPQEETYMEGIPYTSAILPGESRIVQNGMSIEAVDQVQLVGAGASVQFTGNGATNIVLRSGTNQFHGAVYEYFRNTDLDARPFFATFRPPEHRNEFGGTAGGPIKKNKIFFFGAYNLYRSRTWSTPANVTVPTAAEMNGDFSAFPAVIYDPRSTNCSSGPCTRQPFTSNVIPPSQLSSISTFLQNAGLPAPQNSNVVNNLRWSVPTNFNNDTATGKGDWNLSDTHRFSVMFSHGGAKNVPPGPYSVAVLPYPYGDGRNISTFGTLGQAKYTWVPSPNLVNQLSFGFARLWIPIKNVTIDGDWMNKAGAKGLPAGEAASAFPVVSFSGPNAPTSWRGANSPAFNEAANNFTLLDNLSWTRGKHSVMIGLQTQWLQENIAINNSGSTATWAFSNSQTAGFSPTGTLLTSTGSPYASYLLGAVSSNSLTDDYITEQGPRFRTYSWWIGDTYQATSHLSVNIGIRHDINTPWVDVNNHLSWLNPTTPNMAVGGFPGALEFAGYGPASCQCRNNWKMYWNSLAPRGGFAYSLGAKTVLRGGYMMTYSRTDAAVARQGTGLTGYIANPSFPSSDGYTPAYYWQSGIPSYQRPPFLNPTLNTGYNTATGATGSSMSWGDPQVAARPPRYQMWNFGIQRAITSSLTVEADYVGGNTHGMNGGTVNNLSGPGLGFWSDQLNPKYLPLGNLLTATATPANVAAAQAIFPGIALPYANFVGTISQMLRPFPQYSSVSVPFNNVGNANYNSLQVIVRERLSHGLVVDANYTWMKAITDTTTLRSGWITQKTQTTAPVGALNVSFSYHLPVGKDHKLFAGNPIVRAVASNWLLSGVQTYRSGSLFGSIGAVCNLPNAGSCYADFAPGFSGPVRINGDFGSGNLIGGTVSKFLSSSAFVSPAAYTYGNTPPVGIYGLRAPALTNTDVSLRREFHLGERLTLRAQMDVLNMFNQVVFGGPSTNITSADFGTVTSQSNSARIMQVNARIMF